MKDQFDAWLLEVYGDELGKLKPIERVALWVCWKDAWKAGNKFAEDYYELMEALKNEHCT